MVGAVCFSFAACSRAPGLSCFTPQDEHSRRPECELTRLWPLARTTGPRADVHKAVWRCGALFTSSEPERVCESARFLFLIGRDAKFFFQRMSIESNPGNALMGIRSAPGGGGRGQAPAAHTHNSMLAHCTPDTRSPDSTLYCAPSLHGRGGRACATATCERDGSGGRSARMWARARISGETARPPHALTLAPPPLSSFATMPSRLGD